MLPERTPEKWAQSLMLPGILNLCQPPPLNGNSKTKILSFIDAAESNGAKILLDGRAWCMQHASGFWIGPTVILHTNSADAALHEEIFGPVLSVLVVPDKHRAIEIENANAYGNAACIYTQDGGLADWFTRRFSAGMCGV